MVPSSGLLGAADESIAAKVSAESDAVAATDLFSFAVALACGNPASSRVTAEASVTAPEDSPEVTVRSDWTAFEPLAFGVVRETPLTANFSLLDASSFSAFDS